MRQADRGRPSGAARSSARARGFVSLARDHGADLGDVELAPAAERSSGRRLRDDPFLVEESAADHRPDLLDDVWIHRVSPSKTTSCEHRNLGLPPNQVSSRHGPSARPPATGDRSAPPVERRPAPVLRTLRPSLRRSVHAAHARPRRVRHGLLAGAHQAGLHRRPRQAPRRQGQRASSSRSSGRTRCSCSTARAHLRQRRLLLPPLHGERMQAYAPLMARSPPRRSSACRSARRSRSTRTCRRSRSR